MKDKREEMLRRYFREDKTRYYDPPDLIKCGDHYIRYRWHDSERVILTIGCDEGEFDFKVCRSADELKKALEVIIG